MTYVRSNYRLTGSKVPVTASEAVNLGNGTASIYLREVASTSGVMFVSMQGTVTGALFIGKGGTDSICLLASMSVTVATSI